MAVVPPLVEEGGDEQVYLTYGFKVHSAGVGCRVDGTVLTFRILSPCATRVLGMSSA